MTQTADPAMHTAEHMLNQAMVRHFGCGRCFSAHLARRKSKCDYRFARPLTSDEIASIEAMVNARITSDLPVTESFIGPAEAAARFDLGRLPEDAGERIRIIAVGDYDTCPCIGAHVERTGVLGRFFITTTDWQDGVLRIRFKLERP